MVVGGGEGVGERTERPGAKLPAMEPVALAGSLMEEEEPEHELLEVCHAATGERGGHRYREGRTSRMPMRC